MTTPIEPNPPRWRPSTDSTSIVVPGLDTNASINDQIDQIEQLITLKLQNIDANFSRIQHLLSTKLLPAVKRYAVGTEPVREAAKFWTSFYEQAAQVRIPTVEDGEPVQEEEQTQPSIAASQLKSPSVFHSGQDLDVTPSRLPAEVTSGAYDVTASESSFMPANAVSSTPARPGRAPGPDPSVDDQPSWSVSLDLPMARLKNELQSFATEEEEQASSLHDSSSLTDSIMYEEEDTIQQAPSIGQGRAEQSASRIERDEPAKPSRIPRSALPTPRANATSTYVSPLKVKPKTPVVAPKHVQSFLSPKLENEPAFPSPRRPRFERTPRKPTTVPSTSASRSASASSSTLDIPSLTKHASDPKPNPEPNFAAFNDSFDDSIALMQGISPPRTLAFARAPRSSVGLGLLPPSGRTPRNDMLPTLGRTPGKEAADRIRRDLLESVNSVASSKLKTPAFGYGAGATKDKDDTMSTIPTPPSLSRYTRHAYPSWSDNNDTDTSLATMMRRLGLDMPLPETSSTAESVASASHSHSRTSSQAGARSSALAPPAREDELRTPDHQGLNLFDLHQGDQSAIQLGPHPPGNADSDSDSDSLDDEPVHPSQPSTAFIMASSREPGPDDSFGSSNSDHSIDSLGADEFGGDDDAAVHPFARALESMDGDGDGFDDSFDSEGGYDVGQGEEETDETVFGVPPAQRRQQGRGPGQLRLLGEDLLQDTIGIGGQLAKAGRVEESPTPYGPR